MSAVGKTLLTFGPPPLLDAFDRELRCVVRRSDIHGPAITLEIIDAVWDSDPFCHRAKVVVVDGIALSSPDASWILEAPDQLPFFGVDTQDGIATSTKALPQLCDGFPRPMGGSGRSE